MKILRTVTRRGFTVGTAGWFTITSPNMWFAASRLPRRSRFLSEEFQAIPEPVVPLQPINIATREAAVPPRISTIDLDPRHPMRRALIGLAAVMITVVLLYWLTNPR